MIIYMDKALQKLHICSQQGFKDEQVVMHLSTSLEPFWLENL